MKILRGISEGMVMQRGINGSDITFEAEYSGKISANMGCVEENADGTLQMKGIPVGGPYTLVLRDAAGECVVENVYVGDVWVLAGQSNMEGSGLRRDKDIAYDRQPRRDVRACYLNDRWGAATSKLHQQWMNRDEGVRAKYYRDRARYLKIYKEFDIETASGVGTGLFIGLRLRERMQVPQGLIPCAYGGSGMKDWSPDNATPESLYASMLRRVKDCGSHVRGVFWYQGEAEASPNGTANFNANMKRMVEQMRKDFKDANLPFVQAQIGHCHLPQYANEEAAEYWMRVKELQRKMPEWLPNTATVSNANSYLQDLIHIDAQSQEELGGWMADEMVRLITGNGEKMPELASITRRRHAIKRNFSVLELTFDHVIGELKCDSRPYGFSVTVDDEKPYQYPYRRIENICLEGNKVLISVDDEYVPVGRCFVWYGAGFSCVCTITDGAGRPLTAFSAIKV